MNAFQRWFLLSTSAATGVTGVVYWWMKDFMEPMSEFAVINHPLQPWVLKAHILVAPLMVFAVGLITMEHIWKHFRSAVRRGRNSGLSMMWVLIPMVVSGYLIQAITCEAWLAVVVWTHLITGSLYLLGLAAHWAVMRRGRRRAGVRESAVVGRDDVSVDRAGIASPSYRRVRRMATPAPMNQSSDSTSHPPFRSN